MKLNDDFAKFVNLDDLTVPSALSQEVLKNASQAISQQRHYSYAKLTFAHVFAAMITFLFCPQFGLGYFGSHYGLAKVAMQYGSGACALVCGAFFMSVSVISFKLFLRLPEQMLIFRQRIWIFTLLAASSLTILISLAKFEGHLNFLELEYIGNWLAAASIAGILGANLFKLRTDKKI